jgi:hypothetical protein
MSNARSTRSSVVVAIAVLLAGIRCDKHETDRTSGQGGVGTPAGTTSAVGSAKSAASALSGGATRTKEPPPADWITCTKNEDCTLVNWGRCCAPCDPLNFEGHYTAINVKHTIDWPNHEGCQNPQCPQCPAFQPDYPRASMNFFTLCQEGKCVAIDLRFSQYSHCETAKDCRWRFGLGCCEGCGDGELVTYNPASSLDRDVCPNKPQKCPPVSADCKANRHPQQPPECVANRCQLSD